MKRIFIIFGVFIVSLLAGCASAPGSSVVVYDFGLPATRLSDEDRWSRLALEVKAPAWFDSLNVDYRLVYEDSLKLRDYSRSRWAANPGVLIAQHLKQQLGTASINSSLTADCLLRVELQEFSQVFDSPQQSRGLLQATVTLSSAKRQLLAERQLVVEKPAASADASGGVKAMVGTASDLGLQLAEWLGAQEKSGVLKACRPAKP
ncbi:MAG: ABC-type transport auxiliary lipoprotein family protein [Betaproteobacteria bacterium]